MAKLKLVNISNGSLHIKKDTFLPPGAALTLDVSARREVEGLQDLQKRGKITIETVLTEEVSVVVAPVKRKKVVNVQPEESKSGTDNSASDEQLSSTEASSSADVDGASKDAGLPGAEPTNSGE